ncbi:energy-coupling factor ABC transporter permease [Methanosphaera cuniculi]|uniref:energy-coupling factor ABC transporter permease n=1 Tax=Methanosphaera cuniculi TaxID=1077256 RepID=UPI0026F03EDE|nr:energy-coupling factor ABC transporter permease [Methanosphaera cuniculi]
MHLPDGIIPLDQSIIYWVITILIFIFIFYKFSKDENKEKDIVKIAVFAVCCFILSAIQVPSPLGIPIHFFMVPIITLIIGPILALMAVFISLLGQALMLGMGGITSLGANFLVMGVVITITTYVFYRIFSEINENLAIFLSTLISIMFATFTQVLELILSGAMNFEGLLASLIPFYLFIGIIEGFFNILIIKAIKSLKPELLEKK